MTAARSSPGTRPSPRIVLVDPAEESRKVLAERLRAQGFIVSERGDGAEGAIAAIEEGPAAVVADLSMPSMSGVQLCRLLRAEGGTAHVPVVLRGSEGRRNRFWAEQAGAFAYVVKGRMGELVRALRRASERETDTDDFFVQACATGAGDVRERIASHLDAALFDAVIASEVRRLGTSESFERLVDHLSQFVSQVTTYRWLALSTVDPPKLGLHSNHASLDRSLDEARLTLGLEQDVKVISVEDDDAVDDKTGGAPIVQPVFFGDKQIATIAVAPRGQVHPNEPILMATIARELGGALRMAMLVEESRVLATTDALTGLMNRRAFMDWSTREALRCHRYRDSLTVILLDVDHFKQINDRRGHAAGDLVLARVAGVLGSSVRSCDVVARWGGEEFLLALPSTALGGAAEVAERVRARLESTIIDGLDGERIPVTASFGVAELARAETVELLVGRADEAMYRAKTSGRNRVATAAAPCRSEPTDGAGTTPPVIAGVISASPVIES